MKNTYWSRFKRRWSKCFLILAAIGCVTMLPTFTHEIFMAAVIDVVVGALGIGLLWGTVVALVAAAFPSKRGVDQMSG